MTGLNEGQSVEGVAQTAWLEEKAGAGLETLIELCGVECVGGRDSAVAETYSGRYPKSLERLKRMRKRLGEHGFTSFAEA